MEMKYCPVCKHILPTLGFHKNAGHRDGLRSRCKDCANLESREYGKKHRVKLSKIRKAWREKNPNKIKRAKLRYSCKHADYIKLKKRQDYLKIREKVIARTKLWKKNNPEASKRHVKIYSARHPGVGQVSNINRRGRMNGAGTFTAAEWIELCDAYGNRCVACGVSTKLTMDHVVPVCKGGRNEIHNIQPMCFPCNRKKHKESTDYRKAARIAYSL